LQREGKITEAYLVWINGLDEAAREHLGILNNGSFEIEPSSTGFGWHVRVTDRVTATTGTTAGVEGDKALHLIFKRREKPYRHVYQPLFLDPGDYRVEGRVRTDSLTSQGGLKWVVRCLLSNPSDLGESERFLGSSEWHELAFTLRVPEECMAQEIRLVSAGRREHEYKMTGGVWFDGMSMRKVLAPSTDVASSMLSGNTPGNGSGSTTEPGVDGVEGTGGAVFSFGPSLIESLKNSVD
jgi:hypothetical protein